MRRTPTPVRTPARPRCVRSGDGDEDLLHDLRTGQYKERGDIPQDQMLLRRREAKAKRKGTVAAQPGARGFPLWVTVVLVVATIGAAEAGSRPALPRLSRVS